MTPELQALQASLFATIDGLLDCLTGLDATALNWEPPARDANSLYAIASHVLGSVEERMLGDLLDQAVQRDRAAELTAQGESADPLIAQWSALRARLGATFAALDESALDRPVVHPHLGPMTGRGLILAALRHAAEHAGHAQLTRDLAWTKLGGGR